MSDLLSKLNFNFDENTALDDLMNNSGLKELFFEADKERIKEDIVDCILKDICKEFNCNSKDEALKFWDDYKVNRGL